MRNTKTKFPAILLALLLACAPALGQDKPTPKAPDCPVTFPDSPTPPSPPAPSPAQPAKLPADRLYVIRSSVPCLVFADRGDLVTVTKEEGPLKLRAKFYDGPDRAITRSYADKFIYVVEPKGPAGRVNLFVATDFVTAPIQRVIDIEGVVPPAPPVPPDPPKPPDPPVPPQPPAPIPDAGFRVLMVFDAKTLTALPPAQQLVLQAQEVRDFLNEHCVVGAESKKPEWAVWSDGLDASKYPSPALRAAFARKRTSPNWIVISNGTAGYEGPLPANVDEAMTLLRKYAK